MKTILSVLLALSAFWGLGCSSLPDSAQKPELAITAVSLEEENGGLGFALSYSVTHRSPEPLPVESLSFEIFVNGRQAVALTLEEPDGEIPPGIENRYTRFLPASLLPPVSLASLATPMLPLRIRASAALTVSADEKHSYLNPSASWEGLIIAQGH